MSWNIFLIPTGRLSLVTYLPVFLAHMGNVNISLREQSGHTPNTSTQGWPLSWVPMIFFMGDGNFFSKFSLLFVGLVSSLFWFAEFWVVGLMLKGKFIPKLGGPSILFSIPCIDLIGSIMSCFCTYKREQSGHLKTDTFWFSMCWLEWQYSRVYRVNMVSHME